MREGLSLVRDKLVRVLSALAQFSDKYKSLPTLGFTHFQAAQLVTVGKRAALWMNELLQDLDEVEYRISTLRLLGCKGTTGTQASFLELFEETMRNARSWIVVLPRKWGLRILSLCLDRPIPEK